MIPLEITALPTLSFEAKQDHLIGKVYPWIDSYNQKAKISLKLSI